jgi:hypothetical protein
MAMAPGLSRPCWSDASAHERGGHRCWANASRLLLHAAAYWLLDQLRRWALTAQAARLQLDTFRLRVIRIGGWVRECTDFGTPDVCVHLSSHHPGRALWLLLGPATRLPIWGR